MLSFASYFQFYGQGQSEGQCVIVMFNVLQNINIIEGSLIYFHTYPGNVVQFIFLVCNLAFNVSKSLSKVKVQLCAIRLVIAIRL